MEKLKIVVTKDETIYSDGYMIESESRSFDDECYLFAFLLENADDVLAIHVNLLVGLKPYVEEGNIEKEREAFSKLIKLVKEEL